MRWLMHVFTITILFLFVSCGRCGGKGGESSVPDEAGADAGTGDLRGEPVKWKSDSGMLFPSNDLPFGTPVPVKMKKVASGTRWCRYEGTWKMEELIAFYRKYLVLPEGTAMELKGRAHIFKNAHPVHPGNPGRVVEVRILDEKHRGKTAVMIFDASQIEKGPDWKSIPPFDPRTWKPSKPGDMPPEHMM